MFFSTHLKKLPLVFYLSVSYLLVYAVCATLLYLINVRVISRSAREADREDVESESHEYRDILLLNGVEKGVVDALSHESFPDSTLFAIRLFGADGSLVFADSLPKGIVLPGEQTTGERIAQVPRPVPGWSEVYLPKFRRHIQINTQQLADGRVLQLAKSTDLEKVQRHILQHTSRIFFYLASLFSIATVLWMLAVTLRPLRRVTDEMNRIVQTGTFDRRLETIGSPIAELNTLGEYFNLMVRKNAVLIKAMRDTLDNVAHDFRTPLTRIRGTAEVALSARTATPGNDALAAALADIIDDCDSARIQLQNLMDLREMESGCVRLDIRSIDVKRTVAAIVDPYAVLAEDKEISLTIRQPDGEVRIDADENRLSQVLANLIDNAVKYTPCGGHVTLTIEPSPEQVTISVTDTGIGIPEDERMFIGQRLYRSRNARKEKGLGLGISIAQAIVTAHGGRFSFVSALGSGSTFTVALPVHAPPIPALPPDA